MIVQLDLDEAERHRIKRPSSAPVLDRQDGSWWGTIVSLGRTISGMMTGTAEDNGFGNTRSGTVGAGARSGLGRRLGSDIAGDMDGGFGNGLASASASVSASASANPAPGRGFPGSARPP